MKKTLLILSTTLATAILPMTGLASSDDSPVQLDAYALSINTPSCDASIVVNGGTTSNTTGSATSCSTFKGPSSTISVNDLKNGPIALHLHNADSQTVKTYDDSIPAADYQNVIKALDNYNHKSITFNYPYKPGTVHCSQQGEISDVFTTAHHEQVEICFAGY